MTTAAKIVRLANLSRVPLNLPAPLQKGFVAQLRHGFTSSSEKCGEAAVKVGIGNRRIDASNFMNKTGLKPAGVDVGNSLMADAMMSPSTRILNLNQTTIKVEGSRPICRDMQATTPTDSRVLGAMLSVYTGLYRNPHSCTRAYGWETEKAIDVAREYVAKLMGSHIKEIIFTSGATESNNLSIKYVARFYKSKQHIITSQTEHKCVLDLCRHLQDEGHDITYLPIKNNSLINLEDSEKEIRPDTALVSIMTVNNEIGVIQPMQEIGKLCRKKDLFHSKGAQAVGKIPVDVGKWNVDLMCISGPKVYRPKGMIGVSYIHHRPKVRIDPLISGGGQERGLHSGILAHPSVIGPREARRIAQEEIKYTCASETFSRDLIGSSTVRGGCVGGHCRCGPKQFTRTFSSMGRWQDKPKRGVGARDSRVGVPDTSPTKVQGKRARKWVTSYSRMTIPEAELYLNVSLSLPGIPVRRMLEGKPQLLGPDAIAKAKKKVYEGLVAYMDVGGYPTEANPDFKEANINDIVTFTIYPILCLFKHETTRKLQLSREKEITSTDFHTSGMEEFVVMDWISLHERKYVLIAEAKKVSLGEARKQCFLAMKDMWDSNGGGAAVYGFVTMGDDWRMVSYDGKFIMTEKIGLLFDTMAEDEPRWMEDYSILVDCFNVALSDGGWKKLVEVA
ncbi:pyridoxal phosphate-dependent transferase [Tuber borchii]|uniref:cysteine desulfurase n=1 Tax=Tuber borchii TaxID=42251 RepID=A0A2T7A317_TUBBO|nr:pyridoxal phosphate-dependent transferase [Tuber borchii]